MQQLMYRLGMAERIHLGASAGQQRGVEELALAGGPVQPCNCVLLDGARW